MTFLVKLNSENLYQDLKAALFERFKDKEAAVRMHTATALCRLQNADTDVDPSDNKTILQKIMWALQYDPNSYVFINALIAYSFIYFFVLMYLVKCVELFYSILILFQKHYLIL